MSNPENPGREQKSAGNALISCVIPTHNYARFIAEALDSVFAQTRPADEIIVVDDGSTDDTRHVVSRYGRRVAYFHQSRKGPGAARNAGIARSRGSLLCFLDSDDYWHPRKLEYQMARLDAEPSLDGCFAMRANFWADEVTEEAKALRGTAVSTAKEPHSLTSLLVRRSVVDAVGPIREDIDHGEDLDWTLKMEHRGFRFATLDEILCYRRVHRSNISRKSTAERGEALLHMLDAHLARKRNDPAR